MKALMVHKLYHSPFVHRYLIFESNFRTTNSCGPLLLVYRTAKVGKRCNRWWEWKWELVLLQLRLVFLERNELCVARKNLFQYYHFLQDTNSSLFEQNWLRLGFSQSTTTKPFFLDYSILINYSDLQERERALDFAEKNLTNAMT